MRLFSPKYFLFFVLCSLCGRAQAQEFLLFGTVTNAQTQDTLYNINFTNLRSKQVHTTQQGNGYFISLQFGDTIVASCVGYESQRVRYEPSNKSLTLIATVALKPVVYNLKTVNIYAYKTRNLQDAFAEVVRELPEPKTKPELLQPEPQPKRIVQKPMSVSNVEQLYQAFSKSYAQKQIIDEKNRLMSLNEAAEIRFSGFAKPILKTENEEQLRTAMRLSRLTPEQILLLSDYDLAFIIKKRVKL